MIGLFIEPIHSRFYAMVLAACFANWFDVAYIRRHRVCSEKVVRDGLCIMIQMFCVAHLLFQPLTYQELLTTLAISMVVETIKHPMPYLKFSLLVFLLYNAAFTAGFTHLVSPGLSALIAVLSLCTIDEEPQRHGETYSTANSRASG